MPTEPVRARRKREPSKAEQLFLRGERGVVCYRVDRMLRSPPRDKMLKVDRHVTKQALKEIVARAEPDYVHD
jgi:hypothetical protein